MTFFYHGVLSISALISVLYLLFYFDLLDTVRSVTTRVVISIEPLTAPKTEVPCAIDFRFFLFPIGSSVS